METKVYRIYTYLELQSIKQLLPIGDKSIIWSFQLPDGINCDRSHGTRHLSTNQRRLVHLVDGKEAYEVTTDGGLEEVSIAVYPLPKGGWSQHRQTLGIVSQVMHLPSHRQYTLGRMGKLCLKMPTFDYQNAKINKEM